MISRGSRKGVDDEATGRGRIRMRRGGERGGVGRQ